MSENAATIRLADYRPSDYLIDTVDLLIQLHPTRTRVRAVLEIRRNTDTQTAVPLVLDGDELVLESVALDGVVLDASAYTVTPDSLTLLNPPEQFQLTIETLLNPTANTKLMGLYCSNGIFTTQCEADGFRRITYFLDRPDVLSVYTTRLEGAREGEPVLLGNGNLVEKGELDSGRHFAVWHDLHPKPCYLFAVVGGDLDELSDHFETQGGRSVRLGVFVEKGNRERAIYAMDSLKRSMRWDEEVFGCEYDLDVFNVVAVSDFNMGAMENKGLNIFNDKYVLASPETATDVDYAGIESVIAHEYFHNWTGNRITCRDWFQLCLKEGLTVFRDQEFSSDQRSRPVVRISEVKTLRARQFPEDVGPLAHPVRPSAYKEINNFYTATVYEKGAEVIRMLKTLIGANNFSKGMRLYLTRYDGTAATIEQFLSCFAEVSGQDLSHFFLWYEQAGTPRVSVGQYYDAEKQTLKLMFSQETPPTAGQSEKKPVVLPVSLGLVAKDGSTLSMECDNVKDGIFVFDTDQATLVFKNVTQKPVPSLFRNFSAPVNLAFELSLEEQLVLLEHDTDAFNRWQAGQNVALSLLCSNVQSGVFDETALEKFAHALKMFLEKQALEDPAFAALVLTLPSELDVAREIGQNINPDLIYRACQKLKHHVGDLLKQTLEDVRARVQDTEQFSPDAYNAGKRSLANAALSLLAAADADLGEGLCLTQLEGSSTMTNKLAALSVLSTLPGSKREEALESFGQTYAQEPLVLDKWFALQAMIPEEGVFQRLEQLQEHKGFSINNPNRVRALVGAFAMNDQTQFHRADGKGYVFVADFLEKIDPLNPQLASMIGKAFSQWKTMEPYRQEKARLVLEDLSKKKLSRDLADIIERSLQ